MSEFDNVVPIRAPYELSPDILGYESEKLSEVEDFFGDFDQDARTTTKFLNVSKDKSDESDITAILAERDSLLSLVTYRVGILREDVGDVNVASGEPVVLNRLAQCFRLDIDEGRIVSCSTAETDIGAQVVQLHGGSKTTAEDELASRIQELTQGELDEQGSLLSASNFEVMRYMLQGYRMPAR